MGFEKISPGELQLVAFLKDNVGDYENPLATQSSIRIVRKIERINKDMQLILYSPGIWVIHR